MVRALALSFAFLAVGFMAFILGIIYLHDVRHREPVCHGQCKHDEKCQELCFKNGCPHWRE